MPRSSVAAPLALALAAQLSACGGAVETRAPPPTSALVGPLAAPVAPAAVATPLPAPAPTPAAEPPAPAVPAEAPPEPAAEASATLDDPDDEDIDDGEELPLFDLAGATTPEIPLSDAQIRELAEKHPEELGSLSIGSPNAGRLQGGVAMMKGNQWVLLDPGSAWGTQETIDSLFRCIGAVHATHEDTPPVAIGHISARKGGPLSPHVSHQSGRDVDIGYYYLPGTRPGFVRATAENLDRVRTWTLVRSFLTYADVELVLIDSSVQKLLREQALAAGEDPAWVDEIFQVSGKSKRAIIRHAKGHGNHIHVRFVSPKAQEMARRAYPYLEKKGVFRAEVTYVTHKVKKGNTLGSIANRYGTTVEAILALNGMKNTAIRAGQLLRVAQKTEVKKPPTKVVVPPRAPARGRKP